MFNVVGRKIVLGLFVLSLGLAACQDATPTASPPVVGTAVPNKPPTQPVEDTPVVPTATAGPAASPELAGPRTLVYCASSDPGDLYIYNNPGPSFNQIMILEMIYDGPIDNRSFDYQPVILAKLPSLADGDAQLDPVEVAAGDRVVDAQGDPVVLEAGVRVRPSGCQAEECAVEYDGSPGFMMDQLSVTFELLPGLLWSDGQPLTAADSIFSFNLAADPDTPRNGETPVNKSTIERTASYGALDDLRVEWVGLPGYLDATYFLNFWGPLPENLWGGLSAAELLTADISTQKPVGWGPYVIEERNPGESITFSKNENYFRAEEGLPRFDRLVLRFIGDNTTGVNLASLLSNECDLVEITALRIAFQSDHGERLLELSASGQINAEFTTGTAWDHLDFGIQPASYDDGWQPGDRPDFFGDVRTRRAFALCMDRQSFIETADVSRSFVPDSYLPPQHPLYNPEVRHYDFDPSAGSALLEEVGWVMGSDGVRVYAGDNPRIPAGTRLSVRGDFKSDFSREATQVMVDSLAECGIEVQLKYWDREELFADGPEGPVFGRNFDLAEFRWVTEAEPPCDFYLSEQIPGEDTEVFPLGWAGYNDPGFSDPEYERVCRAARQSLPGQPGYVENHLKAQEIFAEQLPVIPLYFRVKFAITRPDFCGQITDPSETVQTWNIEAFDYGPDC